MAIKEDLEGLKKIGLCGADFVLVPLADYIELLHTKRELEERRAHSDILIGRAGKSLLDRNPEVAFFFIQHMGKIPMVDVIKKCKRRFGAAQTPSLSAAYRYWTKVCSGYRQSDR